MVALFLFLKVMTGALAHFSYLVENVNVTAHFYLSLIIEGTTEKVTTSIYDKNIGFNEGPYSKHFIFFVT
jgi:hypothetical protein